MDTQLGVQSLGYLVIETTDMVKWHDYMVNVIGAMPAGKNASGAHLYRLDERAARFYFIENDSHERFSVSGWEVASAEAFEDMVDKLRAARRHVTIGDPKLRGVSALASSSDPAGNRLEVFYGADHVDDIFKSPAGVSKFVTGDLGMGHVVYGALEFDETRAFYRDVMGFGESDIPEIEVGPPGTPKMGACFMHAATGRHHSVALLQMPAPPAGCVHIMVEASELSDVDAAYERMMAANVPVSATLGQHTNDQVTSFYMQSPAGFDVEFGWGGLVVDPATWQVTAHTKMDVWGHEWSWQKAAKDAEEETV